MREPTSTVDKLNPIVGTPDGDITMMVTQGGKLRRMNLSDALAYVEDNLDIPEGGDGNQGGEDNGVGFLFEELNTHTTQVPKAATIAHASSNGSGTISGNTVVGTYHASPESTADVGYVTWVDQNTAKLNIGNGATLGILTTRHGLNMDDVIDEYALEDAEMLSYHLVTESEGTLTVSDVYQSVVIASVPVTGASRWLSLNRNGETLTWSIDNNTFLTTGIVTESEGFAFLSEQTQPPFEMDFDFSECIVGTNTAVSLGDLEEFVIYRSSDKLSILDRVVYPGDFVQLYDGKSKCIVYPLLNRLYDFDVRLPGNSIPKPPKVATLNPNIVLSEESNGSVISATQPEVIVSTVDYLTATQGTLDNFHILPIDNQLLENGYSLNINDDFDEAGLERTATAEFTIEKDMIYSLNDYMISLGNTSSVSLFFYAGADRTRNYVRVDFTRYPSEQTILRLCGDDGILTSQIVNVPFTNSVLRLSLIDGIYYNNATGDTQLLTGEFSSDYVKLVDFQDSNPNITVEMVCEISQDASDNDSLAYSLPIRNVGVVIEKANALNNAYPIVIADSSGLVTLSIDPYIGGTFQIAARGNNSDLLQSLGQSDPEAFIFVMFEPLSEENKYNYIIGDSRSSSGAITGEIAVDFSQPFDVDIYRDDQTLSVKFGEYTHQVSQVTSDKLCIYPINSVGFRSSPALTNYIDLSNVTKDITLNKDAVADGDRIRIVGRGTTVDDLNVNVGDIVEFINDKEDVIVTNSNAQAAISPITNLVVKALPANVVIDTVQAFYNSDTGIFTIGGHLQFSGYSGDDILDIIIPPELGINTGDLTGGKLMFGSGEISSTPILIPMAGPGKITVRTSSLSGVNYISGTICIPNATLARVNI